MVKEINNLYTSIYLKVLEVNNVKCIEQKC